MLYIIHFLETTLKQSNPQPTCKCGMTNRVQIGRIINGTNTGKNEFPWIVGLITHSNGTRNKGIGCGGSIISSKTVITAAHCLYGLEKENIIKEVVVGEHVISQKNDGELYVRVCKNIAHPLYNTTAAYLDYD